jgi:hypothetical protein
LKLQMIVVEGTVCSWTAESLGSIARRLVSLLSVAGLMMIHIVVEVWRVRLFGLILILILILFASLIVLLLFTMTILVQSLVHNVMLQLRDKWKNHVERIGSYLALILHVALVVAIGRQLIDREPRAILNLVSRARTELRVHGDIIDNVEPRKVKVTGRPLEVAAPVDEMTTVESRFLENLSDSALNGLLILVHLSLGERPRILREVGLHQQAMLHVRRQEDCTVSGHRDLVVSPFLENSIEIRDVMAERRNVLKDVESKLLDPARVHRILFLGAEKVEEEPMRELDLKEQPNEIRLLFLRLRRES